MRLYFVRHGESEANLLNEFSNRGLKHGLPPRDRQQAALLAQQLQARFVPFIAGLAQQYGTRAERLVLLGHGGLYRCMLPLILSNIDVHFVMQHHIPNTGVIIAERRPQRLVCLDWCGVSVPL